MSKWHSSASAVNPPKRACTSTNAATPTQARATYGISPATSTSNPLSLGQSAVSHPAHTSSTSAGRIPRTTYIKGNRCRVTSNCPVRVTGMATHAETPNVQINRLRCAIREAWNHTLQDTFDLGHDLDNNALCTLLAPYTTGAAYDSILGGDYKACRALLADHSPAAAATWDDFAGPHKQLMMRLFVDLLRMVNYVNGCPTA